MTEKRLPPAKGPSERTRAEQAALELERPARSQAERDARVLGRRHGSDSGAALAEIAETLGHAGGRVVQTAARTRWFAMCACGYVSTTRNTERDALGGLLHHVRLAIKEWHGSGLPLAAAKKAPPADWAEVARRQPHYRAWRAAVAKEVPAEEIDRVNVGESPESVGRAV